MNPTLAYKIKMLPESPGCYIMKSRGEIIYVGKAVNLKNRVRQYFHGSHTPKVAAMVSRVDDFDLMLCQTNFEALTLECNLIKKHRPFYNILLKDDKHYPYLRIDLNEPFPRLTLARNMDDQRAGEEKPLEEFEAQVTALGHLRVTLDLFGEQGAAVGFECGDQRPQALGRGSPEVDLRAR